MEANQLESSTHIGKLVLSLKDTAIALGVCKATVLKLIDTGNIPHLRVNRRILIPRAALEQFIEQNTSFGPPKASP